MIGKLLFGALLAVLAYKAFGWWRTWQATQDQAVAARREPEMAEDLRRCSACDRYVAASSIAACARADCPLKG